MRRAMLWLVPAFMLAAIAPCAAQSSAVTTCMMICNAQAAACQSNCLIPGTPPTTAATTTSNATANTACILNCNTTQLTCQTSCARQSPSP